MQQGHTVVMINSSLNEYIALYTVHCTTLLCSRLLLADAKDCSHFLLPHLHCRLGNSELTKSLFKCFLSNTEETTTLSINVNQQLAHGVLQTAHQD